MNLTYQYYRFDLFQLLQIQTVFLWTAILIAEVRFCYTKPQIVFVDGRILKTVTRIYVAQLTVRAIYENSPFEVFLFCMFIYL